MIHKFIELAKQIDYDHWPFMPNWENWLLGFLFVAVSTGFMTVAFILPLFKSQGESK